MDQAEFDCVKNTFPWHERTLQTKAGGLVQVIDRFGQEVPIFTMTRFLVLITNKMAQKSAEASAEAAT